MSGNAVSTVGQEFVNFYLLILFKFLSKGWILPFLLSRSLFNPQDMIVRRRLLYFWSFRGRRMSCPVV